MFERHLIIDAKDHLVGRLAAYIAKSLLNGQTISVTRCELLCLSGTMHRTSATYASFIRKRTATNPKRGPIHFHSPAKFFWRTVRGMLPHKTARGQKALLRLKCFEGVPQEYVEHRRVIVGEARKEVCLKKHRKYVRVSELMKKFGWKYESVIEEREEKRKEEGKKYWQEKCEKEEKLKGLREECKAKLDPKLQEVLAAYSF
eukprot:snap_masked-scaffold_32-processed-gene-1.12-mRNA-1 protein AED:0.03 eAED:0.03 QI:127/1/1/1/0/0/2/132/201